MYGSTDNIVADFSATSSTGTHFMGDEFTTTTTPVFSIGLQGPAPFSQVVVVKNGMVVFTTSNTANSLSFTYQDPTLTPGQQAYY